MMSIQALRQTAAAILVCGISQLTEAMAAAGRGRSAKEEHSMAEAPQGSAWPQLRRGLVIFAILAGGMAVFSLIGGRRGDFEAGLPGAIVGGLAAAVVVGVELIGRRLARKQPGADGKGGAEPREKGTPKGKGDAAHS
jgi:hypothetical protein